MLGKSARITRYNQFFGVNEVSELSELTKWVYYGTNCPPNLSVYVFIGENWALLDFIDIMNDRNLLSTGEYVVLAIDNSIDDVSDNQVST